MGEEKKLVGAESSMNTIKIPDHLMKHIRDHVNNNLVKRVFGYEDINDFIAESIKDILQSDLGVMGINARAEEFDEKTVSVEKTQSKNFKPDDYIRIDRAEMIGEILNDHWEDWQEALGIKNRDIVCIKPKGNKLIIGKADVTMSDN